MKTVSEPIHPNDPMIVALAKKPTITTMMLLSILPPLRSGQVLAEGRCVDDSAPVPVSVVVES
jgi:hypothetical protein